MNRSSGRPEANNFPPGDGARRAGECIPSAREIPLGSNELRLVIATSGLAFVTLDRPQVHNAFDEPQIERLIRAFESLGIDDSVRAVVLRGTGRHFCAGADIGWMRRAAQADEANNIDDARRFSCMMRAVANCPKPVVAVVQGAAFGGGMGLVCAADIVLAAEDARFALTEAKFGILPAVVGPYVVNAVGRRWAIELALTCRTLSAPQAQAIGLVHQVAATDELDAALLDVLRGLLRSGPMALCEIKSLLGRLSQRQIDDATADLTARTIARVRATSEAKEGFAAFIDKREPGWVKEPRLD
ncbi:MAG: enoyl-CoA hydratase/isomerase family protein [Betaproteobacteria bacterium]|nr:enoyl-CoA hydratase/isomerase family protein [Betaproteobacteria bacterium]MDE2122888.1 enoyl-CoA hydratase/isomerase family protein [Betaproteobacteria bacterium]MDE2187645.1 enoyl-CoA hydratase/isomerase family protein [Betaproteobacteria bacterium]MDE2325208.1 enoyl-CoA hydratase/isomerase family protein [Betaproteobacteria bacterium]